MTDREKAVGGAVMLLNGVTIFGATLARIALAGLVFRALGFMAEPSILALVIVLSASFIVAAVTTEIAKMLKEQVHE